MIMGRSNSGVIVIIKSGKKGRTYHKKGFINGKVPVYLEQNEGQLDFSDKVVAVLCVPESLKIIGYID